jgi:hypothetical protein
MGGTSGSAGTVTGGAGGTSGASGSGGATGGTGGMVVVGACDWTKESGECASVACVTCNPDMYNTYCGTSCQALIDCVEAHPDCSTDADPLCSKRDNVGTPNDCTQQADSANGDPFAQALELFACVCGG